MPAQRLGPSSRRYRNWGLSLATVAFAGATLVLLPEPEADAPTPASPSASPPAVSTPAVSTPAAPLEPVAHVDLDGPGIDGSFSLATGAVVAGDAQELLAELRLLGIGAEGAHVPVAIAVVLDHSGSMLGEKIASARESIMTLLGAMAEDDRLAVVVYDDTAELLQPLAPARILRRSLEPRVRRVAANGGTNIPAGLALGIEALREAPEGAARRIILISDGQDGSGRPLSEIAAGVGHSADARVVTSSLGVGVDYDATFMTTIADAGHGNYAFLEHGALLESFLRRELDESSATVAEGIVAEITLPAGVQFVATHGAVGHRVGDTVRVELGALFSGERRKVVFEMTASAALDTTLPLPVRLLHRSVTAGSSERPAHLAQGTVVAAVVATEDEVELARDTELYPDALATVLDAQQTRAVEAWRSGDRAGARTTTEASLVRYRRAAARMPSPVFASRMSTLEAEMNTYDAVDPLSLEGRRYDLGSGASRRASSEAY